MLKIIFNWILQALSLLIVANIIPGIRLSDFKSALVAVIIMGLVNVLIKPVLFLISLPITILSLGLFIFVINALMFMLVSAFTPGFKVDGFVSALAGSLVFSVISSILHRLTE